MGRDKITAKLLKFSLANVLEKYIENKIIR